MTSTISTSPWAVLRRDAAISFVAIVVASCVCSVVEVCTQRPGALQGVVGLGFFLGVHLGPALVLSIVIRQISHQWRWAQLLQPHRSDTGGVPRLAAGLSYAIVSLFIIGTAATQSIAIIGRKVHVNDVFALLACVTAVVVVGGLLFLSYPAIRGLTRLFTALDRRVYRRWQRSIFTPRAIALGGLAVACLLGGIAWIGQISPRLGDLDTKPVWNYLGWVVVIAAVHAGWSRLCRWRPRFPSRAVVGSLLALTLALGAAFYARLGRPKILLEVWLDSDFSSKSIELIVDVQAVRQDVRLPRIRPKALPGRSHPNIILVTVDTLRADQTPLHGGRSTMPALQRLAARGTQFEWAFSPSNVTRRSLPAIVTGVNAARVRGRVTGWAIRLDPRHVLLAERLRAAGYATAGFFCCDSFFGPKRKLGLVNGLDHVHIRKNETRLGQEAADWIREHVDKTAKQPTFVWVHFFGVHNWNQDYPSRKYGADKKKRYRLMLKDFDGRFQPLADVIHGLVDAGQSHVVISSDHGEGLGDGGERFHASNLRNSQTRVPFVFVGPGVEQGKIREPVSVTDFAPTILELAGYEPFGFPQMDGSSLAPLLRRQRPEAIDDASVFITQVADLRVKTAASALVRGRYKLIQVGKKYELYDIFRDPQERENLANKPAERKRLQAMKHELKEMTAHTQDISFE